MSSFSVRSSPPPLFNDSCPSCLEDFTSPDPLNPLPEKILQCRHRMHEACYRQGIEILRKNGCYLCRAPVQESIREVIARMWKKGKEYGSENSENISQHISAVTLLALALISVSLNSNINESVQEAKDAGLSNLGSHLGCWSILAFSIFAGPDDRPDDLMYVANFGPPAAAGMAVGFLITRGDIGINAITGLAALSAGLSSYCTRRIAQSISNRMGILGRQRQVKQVVSHLSGACFAACATTARACSCASSAWSHFWRR